MGNDNSKSKCLSMAYHRQPVCQRDEKAECDWDAEQGVINEYFKNLPTLIETEYLKLFTTTRNNYLNQLQEEVSGYIKASEDQYKAAVDSYQQALNDFAHKGYQACDDIKNSPEYKQKVQETEDLKKKQVEESEALQKMNFENLHREEIDRALRKLIPGENGCDFNAIDKEREKKKLQIEQEVAEEEGEDIEGGNLPETIYKINKRYILHTIEESPLDKIRKVKKKI